MYTLKVRQKFDAAHRLEGYAGDCSNLHGHTWMVEVEIEFNELDKIGMGADFKEIKDVLNSILPDHTCINDWFDLNPTAENLSKVLYRLLRDRYFGEHNLRSVTVWESENAGCRYTEDK